MKLYGVVTMDIVKSRWINNREEFQEKLKEYFHEMQRDYAESLVSDICFTLGDEWQLIINKPQQCYSIVHDFQKLLWQDDINIYAGIGIGELKTSIDKDTRMMDGPCFAMAREAINIAKEASKKRTQFIQSRANKVFLKFSSKHKFSSEYVFNSSYNSGYNALEVNEVAADLEAKISTEDIINVLIENNEILKSKLTSKQRRIYNDYQKFKSYRKIVEANKAEFNETIGGISQKLNTAEYFTIQRNQEMIESLISLAISSIIKQ